MERHFRESGETTASPARRRALALIAVVGIACVLLLVVHRLPVHSDDGPGTVADAFQSPLPVEPRPTVDESTSENLLVNGPMDQLAFYWRYPNHWIAGRWFEWFSTAYRIPEFNDGYERGFVHSDPSSQRLQLWGGEYAGGLMQSAAVKPCAYYRFQAYGQSRPGAENPPLADVASHMKVGIEPYGWMSGRDIRDYDPGLGVNQFPNTVVWSAEATHNFVFRPYRVTTEALSDTITVILFSNPEVNTRRGVWWNDTVWDTATLVEVPPPGGKIIRGTTLPEPDGWIANVNAVALPQQVVIEWDTLMPASSQVVYRVIEPTASISATATLSYSFCLPFVSSGVPALKQYSPLDTTPTLHHQVVLTGLPSQYLIDFAVLSRWFNGQACVTSASSAARAISSGQD